MTYDNRGLLASMTQAVRSPESSQMVTRSQSFTHRPDATIATTTHAGQTSTYTRSPAGWVESMTDWRNKVSTTAYSPAGSPTATSLGGSASSLRSYKPDGSSASLVWTAGGSSVRSHTAMAYDLGGLRTAETVSVASPAETVSVASPAGTTGADAGGVAGFSYDLLGRLGSYTSPSTRTRRNRAPVQCQDLVPRPDLPEFLCHIRVLDVSRTNLISL